MRAFKGSPQSFGHRWVLATVMTGTFMGGLDTYIVNVSLPTIAATFGAAVAMVQWVSLAYLVAITSALVIAGRAADLWGSRRVYLGGLLTFVLGSALCGAAPTAVALVGFRGVQGLGAAMLLASGQALMAEVFPEGQRGRALAGMHVAVALGFTLGPSIGGLLVEAVGWRWVFSVGEAPIPAHPRGQLPQQAAVPGGTHRMPPRAGNRWDKGCRAGRVDFPVGQGSGRTT